MGFENKKYWNNLVFQQIKCLSFPGNSRIIRIELLNSKKIIDVFREISYYISHKKIILNSDQIKKLNPYKNVLNKLARIDIKSSHKKRILIKNNNLVSLLLKIVLPFIEPKILF